MPRITRLAGNVRFALTKTSVCIRKSEVEKRAEIWLLLLRAVQRGISAWYDNPSYAKSVVVNIPKTTTRDVGQDLRNFLPNRLDSIGISALRIAASSRFQILWEHSPCQAAKDASPKPVYDARIIDKLKEMTWEFGVQ